MSRVGPSHLDRVEARRSRPGTHGRPRSGSSLASSLRAPDRERLADLLEDRPRPVRPAGAARRRPPGRSSGSGAVAGPTIRPPREHARRIRMCLARTMLEGRRAGRSSGLGVTEGRLQARPRSGTRAAGRAGGRKCRCNAREWANQACGIPSADPFEELVQLVVAQRLRLVSRRLHPAEPTVAEAGHQVEGDRTDRGHRGRRPRRSSASGAGGPGSALRGRGRSHGRRRRDP